MMAIHTAANIASLFFLRRFRASAQRVRVGFSEPSELAAASHAAKALALISSMGYRTSPPSYLSLESPRRIRGSRKA
ncbi:hypothetical protein EVA_18534 [gut metagenome]|uniref:Uncharacterized protein n=1 Tax=gut metagenome TaxID=749906 RepID=J9G191_9ZZZZ